MASAPAHELSARHRAAVLVAVCLAALVGAAQAPESLAATEPLRLAVAANFRAGAERLATAFTRDTGIPVTVSSAASGVLAAQLRRGAPFDLFLAADRERPAALHDERIGSGPPVCYARGRLVLLGAAALEDALANPRLSIAIANARSAPYGRAAEEVLARADFAAARGRRVLRGANVQQALQFHASGSSDLALVARSLAPREGLLVPDAWHAPIDQYALVVATGERATQAGAYLDRLRSAAGRAALAELGYEVCP